ncbi:hypothetical protein GQ457_08G014750 [Hibiscus cannabinus]
MEKEKPLLQLQEGGGRRKWGTTSTFVKELKKVSYMAAPMVAVSVSQYLLQVISLMMVGHVGELALSGVAIATSFTNVTGFSLLFGMAGALETLGGQAWGGAISKAWDLHLLLDIVSRSNLLPSLVRYFQSQSQILPLFVTSCASMCLHVPLCWALVHKTSLGYIGAAIAITVALWFNASLLAVYMRCSARCETTRALILGEVFVNIKEFLSFALPSAVMVCLEWWSFELLVLLSGLLPNSDSKHPSLSTTSLHYFVPYGVGAAARCQGIPHSARVAVNVVMVLGISEAMIVSITLFSCRYVFGYLYSNEPEVIDYVRQMIPLISLSVIVDSLLAVITGVARGTGWQHIGAYVNLGAYYLVGIPVAALLCFTLHLRGQGLWIGILTGSSLQLLMLALVTVFTNWQKQASKAQERMYEEKASYGLLG